MKKLVAIIAVAALFFSCVKEVVEPGMRISGTYAYYDGTGLSNLYVSFEDGYYSQVVLSKSLSYMEDSFWGYSKSYETVYKKPYSIRDGNLIVAGQPRGVVELKEDCLYLQGEKYSKVKSFNKELYSSIILPEGPVKTISYESKEYAVPVAINRPIPTGTLNTSTTASWISGVKVQDGYLKFRASETKVDRTATIGLGYTNADDVTLSVSQTPSTFIKLGEHERTVSYIQSSQSLSYTIENPLPGSALAVSCTAGWVKNIVIGAESVTFDVEENPGTASRTATLTCSYRGAADVSFALTQSGAVTTIVTSPTSQSCTYTGGDFSFNFTVENPRQGLDVTAASQNDWITGVTLSGNTVSYKVAENNSGSSRTGKIKLSYGTFASKEFSVSQSWSASVITTTPTSQAVTYTGGSFSLDFSVSNPREGVTVTAASQNDWITDVTVSTDKVSYNVSENNSGIARVGKVRLSYGDYATKDFTVNQSGKPVQSLSLNKSTLALLSGKSETLVATVEPSDAPLQWTSDNVLVAAVSQSGLVSAIGNGTATITVSAENGKTSSCTVTVTTAVSGITLNKTALSLAEGAQEQLTATISPSTASDKTVSWSSSNTSVATVDQSGNVTAVSKGITTITATANDGSGKIASCSVSVGFFINLSANGSANCYIVSSSGAYGFRTTQGNSSTSVGSVSSAVVLWESYGTSTAPSVGIIINNVSYSNNTIYFSTPTTLKNGNAVIAAKDASGNVLWSWHIWVCSGYNPSSSAQTYKNSAGTMMDRNLGATSATPGDVGALGLLYQWGRKDPFLGSSSISSNTKAKSTLSSWPSPVSSNSSTGKVAYAVAHPTTFITGVSGTNYDWVYSSRDNKLWQSVKTIYDPCPPGWKVPTGGSDGVWSKAANTSSSFSYTWNSTDKGMNFSNKFGSASTIWYPAAGCLYDGDGILRDVGDNGSWWSCTPDDGDAYDLGFDRNGYVYPSDIYTRAYGLSVRCLQE